MKKRESTGKQLILLSVVRIWTQCVSLIKTMMLVRFFSMSEYGSYTKLILILDFALAIFVLNLPSSATYFISKKNTKSERDSFLINFYSLSTIVGIFTGIILYILVPYIENIMKFELLHQYSWFLLLAPLFQIISRGSYYILTSEGKSAISVKISFFNSLFSITTLILSYLLWRSFDACLFAILLSDIVAGVIGYIVGLKTIGIYNINKYNRFIEIKQVIEIYKYIIPIGLSSLVLVINTRFDKFLVSTNYNNEYFAIYANASKELPVSAFSVVVASVIVPKIVRQLVNGKDSNAIDTWRNTLTIVSSVSFFLLVATECFACELFTILYSSKYIQGVNIFRIYLLLIPFHCISYSIMLNAIGETRYVLYSSICSVILNVLLDLLLIRYSLVDYLGVATVIATLSQVLLLLTYSARLLKVTTLRLLPIKNLIKLAAINALSAVIMLQVKEISVLDRYISKAGEAIFLCMIWLLIYLFLIRKDLFFMWDNINIED